MTNKILQSRNENNETKNCSPVVTYFILPHLILWYAVILENQNLKKKKNSSIMFPVILCKRFDKVIHAKQRLATGRIVLGSNPGGGVIFCTCSDKPWGPFNLLYNRYRIIPGGKAAKMWN